MSVKLALVCPAHHSGMIGEVATKELDLPDLRTALGLDAQAQCLNLEELYPVPKRMEVTEKLKQDYLKREADAFALWDRLRETEIIDPLVVLSVLIQIVEFIPLPKFILNSDFSCGEQADICTRAFQKPRFKKFLKKIYFREYLDVECKFSVGEVHFDVRNLRSAQSLESIKQHCIIHPRYCRSAECRVRNKRALECAL